MRKLILAFALALTACATPAKLPTGAVNSVDAGINETLQSAHAAVVQYNSDVAAKVYTPSPDLASAVNTLSKALNVADPLYQSYHAALKANPAVGEPSELAAAVEAVTANLSALQALVKGK